jgi:hypothetical protein
MSAPLHIWSVDRTLVCVPADLPDTLLGSLRALLLEGRAVDRVLELLTAGGLASTPPFVCAEVAPDGVRVVIRGSLEVVAHGLDGSSLTLGAGRSSTWNDDVVADIASLSVAGDSGARFEWVAATSAAPSAPGAPSTLPARPAGRASEPVVEPVVKGTAARPVTDERHTLDEQQFLRLVAPGERAGSDSVEQVAPRPAARASAATGQSDAPRQPAAPAESVTSSSDPSVAVTAGLDFSGLLERTSHGVAEAPSAAAPPPPSATTATSAPPGPGALGPPPAPSRTPPATAGEQPVTPLAPGVRPPRRTARLPISAVPKADPIVAPPPGPPPPPPGAGTGLGEHDGRTITLADLRRVQDDAADLRPLQDDTAAPTGSPGTAPPRSGEVRAVRCPTGHANPPTSTTCRMCGQAVTDTTVMTIPRPVVARLVFDSGLIVDVDRPQLIGRRPSSPPEAEEIPNLVTIPSPDSEISRAHAAVRVEGWDVLVEDVGSTNGTEVRLPGRDPVRLREHDPVLVVSGTEVILAAVVRFQVEAP